MKKIGAGLNQSELKKILKYDCESGHFFWLARPDSDFKTKGAWKSWNAKYPGTIAGTLIDSGYVKINIRGKIYAAHRLVWLYLYDKFPPEMIDHINGVPSDNRRVNLRLATACQNMMNVPLKVSNSTGVKGLWYYPKTKRWIVHGRANRKNHWLGAFDNIIDAVAARRRFERVHHGDFANAG
ncbi:HNH endonuclease [Serratia liquefaciens]|uniref:HNH endonuclease n=1 Tax=Serratia liquefaciens TaxID=614 RepID=UPI00301B833A